MEKTIDYAVEVKVLPESPLVNLKKKEAEVKHGLKFASHYHLNAHRRSDGNRMPYYKNLIIKENMALELLDMYLPDKYKELKLLRI